MTYSNTNTNQQKSTLEHSLLYESAGAVETSAEKIEGSFPAEPKNDVLSYALAYNERGYPVLPVKENDKAPANGNGARGATIDRDKVIDWFKDSPNLNIGICGANEGNPVPLIVIDCDKDGERDGREDWEEIRKRIPSIKDPRYSVTTPSGGVHLYYRLPAELIGKVPASTKIIFDGKKTLIDFRVGCSYVVAPPSVRQGVGTYRSLDGNYPPRLDELSELPVEFFERVGSKPRESTPLPLGGVPSRNYTGDEEERAVQACRAYIDKIDPSIQGQNGSKQLMKVINIIFFGFDLSGEPALRILQEFNSRCQPPWTDRELNHAIESAFKNPPNMERGSLRPDCQAIRNDIDLSGILNGNGKGEDETAQQGGGETLDDGAEEAVTIKSPITTFEDYIDPPIDALPDDLCQVVRGDATRFSCPLAYPFAFWLSFLSGAVGFKATVSLGRLKNVCPRFHSLIVGDSGTGKTPVIKEYKKALTELRSRKKRGSQNRGEPNIIETIDKLTGPVIPPWADDETGSSGGVDLSDVQIHPNDYRFVLQDATTEAIGKLFSQQQDNCFFHPILYLNDEAGFLNMDVYKNGKGGDKEKLMQFMDGDAVDDERVEEGRSRFAVESYIVLFGGTQPSGLKKFFQVEPDAFDRGFVPRVAITLPPPVQRLRFREREERLSNYKKENADNVLKKILLMFEYGGAPLGKWGGIDYSGSLHYTLDKSAVTVYARHFDEGVDWSNKYLCCKDSWAKAIRSSLAKWDIKVLEIALMLQVWKDVKVSDFTKNPWSSGEKTISSETMEQAVKIAKWFIREFERVVSFGIGCADTLSEREEKIIQFIKEQKGWVTSRDIGKNCFPKSVSAKKRDEVMQRLERLVPKLERQTVRVGGSDSVQYRIV